MTSANSTGSVEILRDFTNRALRENKGMVPVLTFALKEVFDYIEALELAHAKLLMTAHEGIDYVARANYAERVSDAKRKINEAYSEFAQQDKGKEIKP